MAQRAKPGTSRSSTPASVDSAELDDSDDIAKTLPLDKLRWPNLMQRDSCEISKPLALLACGSFNPVTNQHLRMMELARHEMQQVRVHFLLQEASHDASRRKKLLL